MEWFGRSLGRGLGLAACSAVGLAASAAAFTLVEPGHFYNEGSSTSNLFSHVLDLAIDDAGVAYGVLGSAGEVYRFPPGGGWSRLATLGWYSPGVTWANGALHLGASDGSVYRLDLSEPSPVPVLVGTTELWNYDLEMAPETFGPYGGWIVAAGSDGISVLDPETGNHVRLVEGIEHRHLAVTPSGAIWATRSGGIYELAPDGRETYRIAYGSTQRGLAIHPTTGEVFHGGDNGRTLVRRGLGQTIRTVATTDSGQVVRDALRFTPDGSSLAIGHQPRVGAGFTVSTIDCFSADLPQRDERPVAYGDVFVAVARPAAIYRVEEGTHCRAPFAWGLSNPVGLAITPDLRLLVSEVGGLIRDVTEGGDFAGTGVVVTGLDDPRNLLVDRSGRVLVSEATAVRDVTAGGDASSLPRHAWDLSRPRDLIETFDGRILVAEESSGEVTDITAGGSQASTPPLLGNLAQPYGLAEDWRGWWFVVEFHSGRLWKKNPALGGWSYHGLADRPDDVAADFRRRLLVVEEYEGRIVDAALGGPTNRVVATGFGDFPQQLAVVDPLAECRDGIDNDLDGDVDSSDVDCSIEKPWSESVPRCGLGAEIGLLAPLMARRTARRARRSRPSR